MEMIITPTLLESAILSVLEDEASVEERFQDYSESCEGVLQLMFSDDLDPLSEGEKGALMFITDVLLSAHKMTEAPHDLSNPELIDGFLEEVEEKWERLKGNWTEKLDLFYESETEQEAIAFIEEVLEEEKFSPEGKEAIYLTSCAIVKAMTSEG